MSEVCWGGGDRQFRSLHYNGGILSLHVLQVGRVSSRLGISECRVVRDIWYGRIGELFTGLTPPVPVC